MSLRYFECFAGAGGLSLGLDRAGLTGVGHAEVAPHARAVLRERFPGVPLWGDVTALDGTAWRGHVDLLSGGSPCQDLLVAGKRAGLMAGARSSLFFHQVRLWHACEAPYFLWENVHGALSSHHGEDFARVLGACVGADVPVPGKRRGRRAGWSSAGRVAGPAGVAAWRVFDLQHFGPPQRRRRVFVVAVRYPRASHVDPAEVLALREGVCGHPAPRDTGGQAAPSRLAEGLAWSVPSLAPSPTAPTTVGD